MTPWWCAALLAHGMSVRIDDRPHSALGSTSCWLADTRSVSPAWHEFERAVVSTHGDLDALMVILWAFAPEVAGHSLRMGAAVLELAAAAGLTAVHARRARDAAWVHDLGRLAVPPSILEKPGELTTTEALVMQEHPAMGAALLTLMPPLRDLAPLVIAVHERWDGEGYPRGLRAAAIPIEARMLAIVDAYDALTSPRAYRTAVADAAAVAEVLCCAGTQFDPDLVRCWVRAHDVGSMRVH